ncbi:MAG: hypothetical protein V4547_09070 [Bacteroidota bacterium]
MNRKINSNAFLNELLIYFPQLEDKIKAEERNLVHPRMEIFSDYSIEQIEKENYAELKKCFDFHESRIEFMVPELINALTVSYCESIMLGKCASKMERIKTLMPIKFKTQYLNYEKYYNDLVTRQNEK